MTKQLLFLFITTFLSYCAFSQEAVDYRTLYQVEKHIDDLPLNQEYKKLKVPPSSPVKSDGAEVIYIGTSGNIYTILLEGPNQVSYDPNINTVSFIHRKDDVAPYNGVMEYDYSTDGGATWEINQGHLSPDFENDLVPEIGNGLRYPNGVLWAPEGSSSADDAYIVGHGPALDSESATWGNIFEVSSKLDGSNLSEVYTNYAEPWEDPNTEDLLNVDFHPYGTVNVNGNIWSLSTQINPTEDATHDTITNQLYYLTKATFNEETLAFDYEVVRTFEPDWVRLVDEADGTESNFTQTYTLGFSPDGQIGYVVLVGSEVSEFDYPSVPKPVVWKTEDGGETWEKRVEFNFQTLDNIQNFMADAIGGDFVRPWFTDTDCAVDENGELHLFSHLLSGFTNDPDSLGFITTALETQFFYHVKTDGDSLWTADIITEVVNDDSADAFALGTQPLRFKPQIARSPDGSKIFFSYHKAIGNEILTSADVYARGYDVATGIYAAEKNLTDGTDQEQLTFYQTMSPICIQGGECHEWELPIVFIFPGADDLSSCQHIYLYGAGFDPINFDPSNIENMSEQSQLNAYPNPSEGLMQVSVPANRTGDIYIYDVSGREVFSQTNVDNRIVVDIADQKAGTYILKYVSSEFTSTKSLVIK